MDGGMNKNKIVAKKTASKKALKAIEKWGNIEGDHHKQWLIDQIVRELTGENYNTWVNEWENVNKGQISCKWDTGIAP
jgi:hypothetical protein